MEIDARIGDRFWPKVDIRGPDECWLWKATVSNGYGNLRINGKTEGAHRISFVLTSGSIPENAYVIHHCDVKLCCNPRHLHLGDAKLNTVEAIERGLRLAGPLPGELHPRAKLTDPDVHEIRRLYKTSNLTQEFIGTMFGINQSCVSDIVNRKLWVHI